MYNTKQLTTGKNMKVELDLEEAINYIEAQMKATVTIVLPKKETTFQAKNLYHSSAAREDLVRVIKYLNSVNIDVSIQYLRLIASQITPEMATRFAKMTDKEFNQYVATSEVNGVIWDRV
jgi:hypothetical protein